MPQCSSEASRRTPRLDFSFSFRAIEQLNTETPKHRHPRDNLEKKSLVMHWCGWRHYRWACMNHAARALPPSSPTGRLVHHQSSLLETHIIADMLPPTPRRFQNSAWCLRERKNLRATLGRSAVIAGHGMSAVAPDGLRNQATNPASNARFHNGHHTSTPSTMQSQRCPGVNPRSPVVFTLPYPINTAGTEAVPQTRTEPRTIHH